MSATPEILVVSILILHKLPQLPQLSQLFHLVIPNNSAVSAPSDPQPLISSAHQLITLSHLSHFPGQRFRDPGMDP